MLTPFSEHHCVRTQGVTKAGQLQHHCATNRAYEKDLFTLAVFLGEASAIDAGIWVLGASSAEVNMVVKTWQTRMLSSGHSPATANRRVAAIRSLLGQGRALGVTVAELRLGDLRTCPTRDTRGPGAKAVAQMVSLLEHKGTSKSIRDLCIVRFLYDLGLVRTSGANIGGACRMARGQG
jgi:integrase/recombinase XerC